MYFTAINSCSVRVALLGAAAAAAAAACGNYGKSGLRYVYERPVLGGRVGSLFPN